MNFPNSTPSLQVTSSLFAAMFLAFGLACCVHLHAAPRQVILTCAAYPESVFPGDPVTVTATAKGLDRKLNAIYSWSGMGVTGDGASVTVATALVTAGSYTVRAEVKEGKPGEEGRKPNETASCSANITVKGFEPPTISCSVNPRTIQPGGKATITSVVVSPQNRPLTYSYSVTAGKVTGSSATAKYSSVAAPTGTVEITCNVSDDKGNRASADTSLTIVKP